ncbi:MULTISPECIES: amidase [unclassified Achromobacter]|uniref:amidase n=1 Tax=unclassified Achromobacter TaxID=2626865 RepID=UPI000B51739D|nr:MULTISPECIES: amidase family protein [unclassified Achromobacter]OWT80604.1 amidase [Achromobacter sp. HZ34]OWT82487.1 amidase [Achromobacter sp. HZ28]
MPASVDSLVSWSTVDLRRAIGDKTISPVELLQACLARIESLNPHLNAITATCYDRARQEAKAAEEAVLRGLPLGPLHGLPLGVKDLEETEGLLTTFGSPMYRGHVPAADNLMVGRMRAAGAIVVGKTNVPELGAGANTRNPVWGATGNPFDPRLNCGGSSGGSAVALATDMLPLCTGSDTGGSLRIPAAKCGVIGFRPSPGLVPVERRALGWTPISVVGPMGRSMDDVGLHLSAIAGRADCDPLSYDVDAAAFASLRPRDLGSLRVGYTVDLGVCDVDDDIRRVFLAKIQAMHHLFKSCDEVRPDLAQAHRCFDVIRAANYVARYRDAYEADPANLGPNPRANYEMGASMTLADYTGAHLDQTRMFKAFQALYQDYDVILAPTTPVTPFPWTQLALDRINGRPQENYYRWLALTYVTTLMTNPSLSMPCGRDHAGMPFGMQVVGGFRQDLGLLEICKSLEWAWARHPDLARPLPDLDRLRAQAAPDFRTGIVTAPPDAALVHGSAAAARAGGSFDVAV